MSDQLFSADPILDIMRFMTSVRDGVDGVGSREKGARRESTAAADDGRPRTSFFSP